MSLVFVLAFITVACGQPSFSRDGMKAVLNWTNSNLKAAEFSFTQPRYPSPSYWSEEIVYSIVVDRFRNGDPANDHVNLPQIQKQNGNTSDLYGIESYRHGGDLQGIIDRLDYLENLGITSLWITPILYNWAGEFHGYCLSDPSQIDPGFGTRELFRLLVSEAHRRGIRVVMDIVINHLCSPTLHYVQLPSSHYDCTNELYSKTWSGVPGGSSAQGTLDFGNQVFGPFDSQYFFSRCGPNSGDDTGGEGSAAVFGDFVSTMFDFDTRDRDFQTIFTEIHKYWVAYADIDGFRLDAAKHVTEDFLAYFSTQIRDYGVKLGKNNFYVVGEVAADVDWESRRLGNMETDPNNPYVHGNVPLSLVDMIQNVKNVYLSHPNFKRPGLTGIYDFFLSGNSKNVFTGIIAPSSIANYLSTDFQKVNMQSDMRQSWYLLEIHDWPRFLHWNPTDRDMLRVGLSYLLTLHGQPIIYYGAEQGFNGVCNKSNINVGRALSGVISVCDDGGPYAVLIAILCFLATSSLPLINAIFVISRSSALTTSTFWTV
eukprot:TRINITY_DN4420_c0_g1_i2.p1 TRINITY_DN4420_c0_g1~~TRINITY_DN4420_c0_g1_i2.p1  ORF type:complete len:540 (-),score=84.48 TRINITY_DN4420_c0_g1_i2:799-2418(-)